MPDLEEQIRVQAAPGAELQDAIDALDPARTRTAAAALLELITDGLSWTRGMSVVRQRGDRSLGDRWPSVAHVLRKTDADDIAEQITGSPVFRRLIGHRAPATSMSTTETTRFGNAVLALLRHTRCERCGEWWRDRKSVV